MKRRQFSSTRIAYDAVLIACCAVLGMIGVTIGTQKITFEGFPVVLGALLFGPVDGLLIGGLGTFISQLLRYGIELSTPLWILPYMVSGLFTGMFAKIVAGNLIQKSPDRDKGRINAGFPGRNSGFWRLLIVVIANGILVTACNTVSLLIYYQYILLLPVEAVIVSLPVKIIVSVVKSVLYAAVLPAVLGILRKVIIKKSAQRNNADRTGRD